MSPARDTLGGAAEAAQIVAQVLGVFLGEDRRGSSVEKRLMGLIRPRAGEPHHAHRRMAGEQLAGGVRAIHARHPPVHHHDIGRAVGHARQAIIGGDRFVHDIEAVSLRQDATKHPSGGRAVVDDEHPNACRPSPRQPTTNLHAGVAGGGWMFGVVPWLHSSRAATAKPTRFRRVVVHHWPAVCTAFTTSRIALLDWAASPSLSMSDWCVAPGMVRWTLLVDSAARSSCWPDHPAAEPVPAVMT